MYTGTGLQPICVDLDVESTIPEKKILRDIQFQRRILHHTSIKFLAKEFETTRRKKMKNVNTAEIRCLNF